jgi:AcrR family transcriptional regulator
MDTSADPPIFEDPAPPSRERILDAAEQLMAERGITATSIAAITAASDAPPSDGSRASVAPGICPANRPLG